LVGVVHAVHVVRHPARVGLDAHHPELRVPLEDAPQDERPHDVLAAADDGEEGVHAGPAGGRLARGEDVEGWRQAERHDRLPELVVRRRVIVLDAGNAGEHDAAEPDRLDGLEVPDALRRRAHRGLADAEQALGVGAAVLGHPAVERVAARRLVVEVAVVADRHADRRVDDLGCDAAPLLIGGPRPGSAPPGRPYARRPPRALTLSTTPARMRCSPETTWPAPAGRSSTRRTGEQPTVAGSKTVTSAAAPGARRPRSAMPKTSAGWVVRRRTASSSESTPRSRTQVPSSSVGAQASHSWLACAPASERPIMVAGCMSSSATIAGSVLRIGMRKRVSRSAASERSRARSTGCTPRS